MEIKLIRQVLEANQNVAHEVKNLIRKNKQCLINIMSAPGSGKTRLLEHWIPQLQTQGLLPSVIEGDITTTNDTLRLKHLGIPLVQINTEFFGGDCHLTANVILEGLRALENEKTDLILIENVGNLVCPAEFDTGASLNIVIISVAEGEDKPLKYPLMFRNSHLALINKIDIADACEADVDLLEKNIRLVNPALDILRTAGKTGLGLEALTRYVLAHFHKETL